SVAGEGEADGLVDRPRAVGEEPVERLAEPAALIVGQLPAGEAPAADVLQVLDHSLHDPKVFDDRLHGPTPPLIWAPLSLGWARQGPMRPATMGRIKNASGRVKICQNSLQCAATRLQQGRRRTETMAETVGGSTSDASAAARWRLRLLGGFNLADATGAELTGLGRLDRALLAYLVLSQRQRHPRLKVAPLLWPNRSEALHSLSESLNKLRKALGDRDGSVIAHKADPLVYDLRAMEVDALALERPPASASAEDLERAASLYAGDLLDGLDVRSDEFDKWLAGERQRLRGVAIDCLGRLARLREDAGQ